jgi:hypothetical protein
MYLDTADFSTVWKLAHNWAGLDESLTDEKNPPQHLREAIYRILSAITWNKLSVRTRTRLIMDDDSSLGFLMDLKYFLRVKRCLTGGPIYKAHLDELYIKRPEVIAWCESDYLPIPSIWAATLPGGKAQEMNSEDEKDDTWLTSLTDRRKQIVASLELAKRLWELKPEQSYQDVLQHPEMRKYGYPKVFSFESFKTWARPYASDYAKAGGRRPKASQF